MDKTFFDKVCIKFKHNYEKIFEHIYPAKNSSGFTERNLSVNFAEAYEKTAMQLNQNCITWYEFQFGEKNNQHYELCHQFPRNRYPAGTGKLLSCLLLSH